jgi:hypothetical protein
VNQIRIVDAPGGTPAPFSAGGDSGSVIVQDGVSCRGAVGLLFAGSSTDTFANPISAVLGSFGVSMVGTNCNPSAANIEGFGDIGPSGLTRQQMGEIAFATDVKERNSSRLFAVAGVIGHGVSLPQDGQSAVIEVYVERAAPAHRLMIPQAIEGVAVRVVETGRVVAF